MCPDAALTTAAPPDRAFGGSVDLRYVARAGLLPELSRQTYDSLWKALREAVLNAVDAAASEIEIDFSGVPARGELVISDNGSGMSMREFCEQFMSLGGSSRFGDDKRFGRIGIGSLALLQYGDAAVIETKRAGTAVMTRAEIRHPWDLSRDERRSHLVDVSAGSASEAAYSGHPDDHFTRVQLLGINAEIAAVGADPRMFYALLERLRHVLPLPWAPGPLMDVLERRSPTVVERIRDHVSEWSAPVVVHAPWDRNVRLVRRTVGDDKSGVEAWSGQPSPILKTLRVPGQSPARRIVVAGYLLNQRHASPAWSGLTARVQNVAVEEHSFFDVTADPGFRKYISGEVWILGDVDRERLINIDRASFNRECADYQVVQRFLSRALVEFKSAKVQQPQRAKVAARRRIEQHIATIAAIEGVLARVAALPSCAGGLPTSEASRRIRGPQGLLLRDLADLGVETSVVETAPAPRGLYLLDVAEDGERIRAEIAVDLVTPVVQAGAFAYALQFKRAGETASPIVVRNRPRRVVINLDHPAHSGASAHAKIATGVALELAFLLGDAQGASGVYERMLDLLAAL